MSKDLPSIETLRKLLRYEPETGKLFWRERTPDMFSSGAVYDAHRCCASWNNRYANTAAFTCISNTGHKNGRIFSRMHKAHRVIWALHYGKWPKNHIDHINGNGADNRIGNLRDVTHAVNMANKSKQNNNTSGHTGVYWSKKNKKWQAGIRVRHKLKNLGYFTDIKDAIAARKDACIKYGFTDRHGT